jgi:Family of unknown function (DUF6496)
MHRDEKGRHSPAKSKVAQKMSKVMTEFKQGKLHSGSKKGPEVHSRKQAIAIGLSEGRRAARRK